MKIGIGSDHNAFEMKESLKLYMTQLGYEVVDYGCQDNCSEIDYPQVAFDVAGDIMGNRIERGILVCGTGIGVAIAAGKVPGIRAALCHDTYSAERARESNEAQILTMGAKVIGIEPAKQIVKVFLESGSPSDNSARKVKQINDKEQEFLKGVIK
ncbi:ribose 5-phosphate isomerase [Alkalihalobacillus alcalophilus ATCC 27647 = CGMCC 1.3604]|uniref:Ribose 5-phosphate isomerase n=1 Tax=Alkalihalobacillus alcalophilus ATCC 27647 = CGMCC 1.3604 TaxID=1218173 RepID=A0A094WQS0_ALKAL|nr:RpiB/LacA/LacB family sugar-phosphate isomerase [Alkalihalobacillus alcalophilus]KGA98383.1 sugar phosphate isomerase [Alkalihalobacillus alcalophilus ATCC 27647 = CGMCC 1.3604]MED1563916.1 RpiB/LacA/LacB family sugar-phosphate isomerase [Alkalihalobacillus alcalophilus]THG91594.1 ribose 5-phosphate isomerase [Alkalihalobacillus alcalophilus ATCC 27647 = CGMCC 1.3604]